MTPDPSISSDDTRLLERMAGGDEMALGSLYDRHAVAVHSLVSAIVRNEADAEEVTTDVFVQAWSSAARFDPGRAAVTTWLLTIARSRALDRVRSRGRRVLRLEHAAEREGSELASPVSNPGADPDVHVERVELKETLRAALDGLPAPQREALELAYFGGYSQSEIAERLATPLGTVKTRIRTGMMSLRDTLHVLAPTRQP